MPRGNLELWLPSRRFAARPAACKAMVPHLQCVTMTQVCCVVWGQPQIHKLTGWLVLVNHSLWALTLEFHIMFTCHERLLLIFFPQPFRQIKKTFLVGGFYKNKWQVTRRWPPGQDE